MNQLQLDVLMYLLARIRLTDKEWATVFGDTPGLSLQMDLLNRARKMADNSVLLDAKVAATHKAYCLNCGTILHNWPNPNGVDILNGCFFSGCCGYIDTQWELTLLCRRMLYG